jgi:hypothetical protein
MVARPTATATIEPLGPRTSVPRDHSITVTIKLSTIDSRHADHHYVGRLVRRSLAGFLSSDSRQATGDVTFSGRSGKTGHVSSVVVAVEGAAAWRGKPRDASVENLRAVLFAAGYKVTVAEKRECVEPACSTEAMVDWYRPASVPDGWFSSAVCGRHHYRTCPRCKSVYTLTSVSAAGQAPSLHCAVCGVIMIGWGGSKIWTAELMTRGEAAGLALGEAS